MRYPIPAPVCVPVDIPVASAQISASQRKALIRLRQHAEGWRADWFAPVGSLPEQDTADLVARGWAMEAWRVLSADHRVFLGHAITDAGRDVLRTPRRVC